MPIRCLENAFDGNYTALCRSVVESGVQPDGYADGVKDGTENQTGDGSQTEPTQMPYAAAQSSSTGNTGIGNGGYQNTTFSEQDLNEWENAQQVKKQILKQNLQNKWGFKINYDHLLSGQGKLMFASSKDNNNYEVNRNSRLLNGADGAVEIESKTEFINKFNSIAKAIGKGNLKQISFAGHSNGQYIFGGFDFQRDIAELDLTVLAPGAKVIYGQCGATRSVTALKTELIKQFDDIYAKEMQEKMQGITIYSRDHTASFNGQFKNSEAIDYLKQYVESGLVKGFDKSTFMNGRFIDSTLPYPAYNVLTTNQEYIRNNNSNIIQYEEHIERIKDFAGMNDVNSLNAENLKLSNLLQQNPNLSKWVEIRSSFIKTMTSTYDNYPIPVNERG